MSVRIDLTRWRIRASVFLLAMLWAAFFMCGILLGNWMAETHAEGVLGYDYALYIQQLSDPRWIFYMGVRHPGLGLVMSPIVLVGAALASVGECWRQVFIILFFAFIAVANVWLVKKIAGWMAVCVFLVFGWTWVLAAVPESFPVAMLSLLLVLVLVKSDIQGWQRWLGWGILFMLCSAITITNGLKVVIAFLVAERCSRRLKCLVVAGLVGIVAAGISFFYLRMLCWNAAHPEMPKTICGALAQTLFWIPDGLGVWGRVKAGIVNFFLVPVLPLAALPFDSNLRLHSIPSVCATGWIWGICVYALFATAFGYVRKSCVVRAMMGMFAVDALIHLVCGWGLHEGWIFSAHWFFMVPIMVGLANQRLKGDLSR